MPKESRFLFPISSPKKMPSAAFSQRWAWLFPARTTCRHPRTREIVRWRCHEANIQRAVKQAALHCRLDGITPHHLRHAFATHSLQNGTFVRDLQVVLGHNSLETTMRYLHTEASRVTSPLREFVAMPQAR
jgi:site-specific recombinase XerD